MHYWTKSSYTADELRSSLERSRLRGWRIVEDFIDIMIVKGRKMPRLVKGGKWVYGWVVVGLEGEMTIPPEAWREYGFQVGEEVIFLPGSRRSGGFGLGTPKLMAALSEPLRATGRVLGRARFGEEGRLMAPPEVGVKPGDRLLTVRGSRYALGFVVQGPIYEEALSHSNIQVF